MKPIEPSSSTSCHPYFGPITQAIRSCRMFFLGNSNCCYSVGCIDFVVDQFLSTPVFQWHIAFKKSAARILSCNPFTKL